LLKIKMLFFTLVPIAQFDRSVCAGEEADEARTDRDDPRRIDIGQNPQVDEPSLQHSTANCAGKSKNDPKNEDQRRLQGFFHCRPKGSGQHTPLSAITPARGLVPVR